MFKSLLIAATALLAAAQPNSPTWPGEWTANVTEANPRGSNSQLRSYSVTNTAIIDDGSDRNGIYIDLRVYGQNGRAYLSFGPDPNHLQCRSRPNNGDLPAPPVTTFAYNGTVTYQGQQAYKFIHTGRQDVFYYTTADTNGYPIAFVDGQEVTSFNSFKPVTQWPAGTFTPPTNCTRA